MSQENVDLLKSEFKAWYDEKFWDHAEALEAVGLSEQDAHAEP